MGYGDQPREVHPVPRVRRGLQDRALPAAPRDVARLIALETDNGLDVDVSTYPVRCNQCKEAPCVDACPTEASHKRDDGIVAIDSNKCFGCRYCVVACPYQNRTYLSRKRNPGYFPGHAQTSLRENGQEALSAPGRHHREVQLLHGAHRRGPAEGSQAGRRPRRHPGLRQHLPGQGPHLRRPRRPQQRRLQADQRQDGFVLHTEYGTEPSVYYIDYRLGNNPSNKAPVEAQTGSHIQHLSTVYEPSKPKLAKKRDEVGSGHDER